MDDSNDKHDQSVRFKRIRTFVCISCEYSQSIYCSLKVTVNINNTEITKKMYTRRAQYSH